MAKNKAYTIDQLDFLRVGYKSMTVKNLTQAFNEEFDENKTTTAIKSIMHKNNIKCGRGYGERLIPTYRVYTDAHLNFLIEGYKTQELSELTKSFNTHFGMDKTIVQIHGIMSRKGIRANRTGHFAQGHKPWNAGTKGKSKKNNTSFKPGQLPPRTKPLGYEREGKDGYIKVKVSNTYPFFQYKHVKIYIENFGPLPNGHCVIFKDSDNRNFDPANLEAVSRAELLKLNRNGYKNHHPDIKPAVLALSKLQVGISSKKKQMMS